MCGYYLRAVTIWGQCLYFFGKPKDIKDSWIRYIQALQQWLLEAISSTQSLSVLLSVMEKSCATQTILLLACWPSLAVIPTCVGVLSSLAVATLWERRVFCSGLPIVRLLFEGRDYSSMASIWRNTIFSSTYEPYLQHKFWYTALQMWQCTWNTTLISLSGTVTHTFNPTNWVQWLIAAMHS